MYSVELYAAVRRAVLVEGVSERQAARRFGISRKSVRKMLRFAVPPGYARSQPIHRPKLGPFVELIEQILAKIKSSRVSSVTRRVACLTA